MRLAIFGLLVAVDIVFTQYPTRNNCPKVQKEVLNEDNFKFWFKGASLQFTGTQFQVECCACRHHWEYYVIRTIKVNFNMKRSKIPVESQVPVGFQLEFGISAFKFIF